VCLTNFQISLNDYFILGFGYGFISALGYAVYIYLTRQMTLPTITLTAWICAGSCAFFLVYALQQGTFAYPKPMIALELSALAVVCTLLPIILFIKATHLIGSIKASLAAVFEPATTMLLGVFFLHEEITHYQYLGFAFMILSLLIVEGIRIYQLYMDEPLPA
jgi:drug/metabolite transporter (DMT)-like permease